MTSKFLSRTLLAVILSTAFALDVSSAQAVSPDSTDPVEIVQAAADRDTGDRISANMKMTLKAGRTRVRELQNRSVKFDEGTKQLLIFASPADIRNTGLLTVDYDDGSKSDAQWLYLSSLRKTNRISGGDRSGSFLGSDLSFHDMTEQDPKEYDLEIIKQSVKVAGQDCWLIEAKPKTKKTKKESGYVKLHWWVSKKNLMFVQTKAWIRKGKRMKYIKLEKIKKVDGIWVAHKVSARTTSRTGKVESTTVLELSKVRVNDDSVKKSEFTQRRLEQGL